MKFRYENRDLFTCYSLGLFHFLKANGFSYLFKERNADTNLFYWVFKKSDELNEAIAFYMKNHKKK